MMRAAVTSIGLAGLLALALVAAACGGGSEPVAEEAATNGAEEEPRPLEPEATEAREVEREPSFLAKVFEPEPELRTVPAGTIVVVEFQDSLSSHSSSVGTAFRARVRQEISIDGKVVIPRGATVVGRVTEASRPKKVGGRARLSLEFHTLELPAGGALPIRATFAQRGKSETPKDAAIIAGSTLGGVVLGEAVDKGEGGVIGGILGGVGGTVAAMKTKGKPVEVPAGTVMSLELSEPVTVEL